MHLGGLSSCLGSAGRFPGEARRGRVVNGGSGFEPGVEQPSKAGSGFAGGLADINWLVAFVTDHFGVHVVAAGDVVEDQRSAFWPGQPFVAPGGHGSEDRIDLAAFVSEAVLVTQRAFGRGDPVRQVGSGGW
jgi:hypothetical protein